MEPFHADWFGQYKYVFAVPKKQLNLFSKYLLLVTLETNDNYSIRLENSNNSWTIQFDSKWKSTIRTALSMSQWELHKIHNFI